ncbi:hypothetical protein, partial [Haematobacter sp.]|uniref:hypothetical protein n=1 Tax=Haematobacter sp. TaxID=2953762 RepID=UPI0028A6DADB
MLNRLLEKGFLACLGTEIVHNLTKSSRESIYYWAFPGRLSDFRRIGMTLQDFSAACYRGRLFEGA